MGDFVLCVILLVIYRSDECWSTQRVHYTLLPALPPPQGMLDELGPKNIVAGGKVDVQERFVEPTIVRGEMLWRIVLRRLQDVKLQRFDA
jgi:hypothetical protein